MDELKRVIDKITPMEIVEPLSYNIVSMMYDRISSKELLHSQIIASLLDPNGQHRLGDKPLKLFLEKIGYSQFGEELSETKVEVEKGIAGGRRIDILLTNGNNAVIIENKLNDAVDQVDQLKDYFKAINEDYENLKMVYLPLYAHKSAKEKVEVVNLYPQDLIAWLEACKEEACQNYITLLQYINQSNQNFMNAQKILAELTVEELKKLTDAAAIINNDAWGNACFEPIISGVKQMIPDLKDRIEKKYILSLWLDGYKFWIDIYLRNTYCDLYVVDYNLNDKKSLPNQLKDRGYTYDSTESEKRYFKKDVQYVLSSRGNQGLIEDIVALLQLSKK